MSSISNMEWMFLLLGAFAFDVFQIVLDAVGAGIVINPPLDIFTGIALQRYFKYRGVQGNWKQWISWIGAPAIEFFTASIFPLGWVLEVAVTMLLDKAQGKVAGAIAKTTSPAQNAAKQR